MAQGGRCLPSQGASARAAGSSYGIQWRHPSLGRSRRSPRAPALEDGGESWSHGGERYRATHDARCGGSAGDGKSEQMRSRLKASLGGRLAGGLPGVLVGERAVTGVGIVIVLYVCILMTAVSLTSVPRFWLGLLSLLCRLFE